MPIMPPHEGEGKRRIGHRGWTAIGLISGLVAFEFLPVLFGPIAVVAGVVVFRRHDEWHGLALVAFGLVALVVGTWLGLVSLFGG